MPRLPCCVSIHKNHAILFIQIYVLNCRYGYLRCVLSIWCCLEHLTCLKGGNCKNAECPGYKVLVMVIGLSGVQFRE